MNLEYIKLDEIIPYERNSNEHPERQIELLAKNFKEFDFDQPITIDKDNVIITGHGRLEAAQKAGLESVPCIRRTDLSDSQVRAKRIADNQLARLSEENVETLRLEIQELALEVEPVKLELLGYSEGDLASLSGNGEQNEQDGSKELKEIEFSCFDHMCPKCGFEFDDKNKT